MRQFRFLWKILFAIFAALSLYTPLGIYPLIAIALAIVFHPHLRAAVRRLSKARLVVVGSIFLVLSAPLVWFISTTPSLGLALLGIPSVWPPDVLGNINTVLQQYFWFWSASTTEAMTPFFGFGSALLIILGLYRLIRTRDTTRSYLILFWLACLMPVLILNPMFTSVSFVPSVMLLAAGLMSLIGYWYRLFPLNPYARVIGLLPIIILVGALITTGLARYIYGYHYNPDVVPLFSKDLRLLPKDTEHLVVSEDEYEFFAAVATFRDQLSVSTTTPEGVGEFVITQAARDSSQPYEIIRIITNERRNNADRFYVLRPAE